MTKIHSLAIGGTRGIGRAYAREQAGPEHVVSILGRRDPVEADRKIPQVSHWTVDLTDREKLTKALGEVVQRNGKIHNLLFFQRYRGQEDPWRGEIETSLHATKFIIEHLTENLAEGGSIVMVSSLLASLVADQQPVGYHVAKAGLNQMARYYAARLGPRGIRVNSVTPGLILKEESRDFYLKNEPLMEMIRKITPLGKMVTAEEAARVIAFLCSPAASMITGHDLVVDGGLSLALQEPLARRMSGLDGAPKPAAAAPEKKT